MKYEVGYKLIHPESGACEAIFAGYTDDGDETWFTGDKVETVTFEGFKEDGWLSWCQNIEEFVKHVEKVQIH